MAETRDSRWILVAEDQQTLRDSWCDVLEDLGYHTIEAADECEALELIRKTVPDLILLNAGLLHLGSSEGPRERDLLCRAIETSCGRPRHSPPPAGLEGFGGRRVCARMDEGWTRGG